MKAFFRGLFFSIFLILGAIMSVSSFLQLLYTGSCDWIVVIIGVVLFIVGFKMFKSGKKSSKSKKYDSSYTKGKYAFKHYAFHCYACQHYVYGLSSAQANRNRITCPNCRRSDDYETFLVCSCGEHNDRYMQCSCGSKEP